MLTTSWDKILDAFIFAKKTAGRSEETIKYYRAKLSFFFNFHIQHMLPCKSPLDCNRRCIEGYFGYLLNNGRRRITVHAHFRALRSFFRWLVSMGLRQDNPMGKITAPKVDEPLPKTVTEEHFLSAIQQLTPERFKNHLTYLTLFVLLFDTGMRLCEALGLRFEDIDFNHKVVKVTGKGGKQRIVPISSKTCSLLTKLIALRMLNCQVNPNDLVFVTSSGTPFSKRNIHKVWWRIQKLAGLNPLPIHGLRHGFARCWLISGGDAFSLQMLLGHSSPSVTQRYVKFFGTDLQNLHQKHSPIERITLKSKIALPPDLKAIVGHRLDEVKLSL